MTSIAKAFLFLLLCTFVNATDLQVKKVEPPNWWAGMKLNKIQLMVYGENLSKVNTEVNSKHIAINEIDETENGNYLFIDIELDEQIPAGDYTFTISTDEEKSQFEFPVLEREDEKGKHLGFDETDIIYLITPDRFANGDTSNDEIEGMINEYNPEHHLGRHGGDIRGIIDHLDYLSDLGITALWVNPLVENNTRVSYHGYAATDFYNIDKRYGSNELYKTLAVEARKRNIKLILDHVSNHISIDHPWMKDLPMNDWIHGTAEDHLNAQHHKAVLSDPHGDPYTMKRLSEGWFVDTMPDLNQKNDFVHNYLIQNTIWWIEYTGLDGIREDTYPYADQKFLSDWAKVILEEYPSLNIVGEVWTGQVPWLAYYQTNSLLKREFDSYIPSVTDYGIRDAYYGYLMGDLEIYDIYKVFAFDNLYPNPDKLVTFIDNHDVVRVMYAARQNVENAKLALTMLMTTRGIPQIYYGTEIGLVGGEDHGEIREDFMGGFPYHQRSAFTQEGRNDLENDLYDFTKELISLRKNYQSLQKGKFIHIPPFDNVYCYFRIYEDEIVMVIVNDSEEIKNIDKEMIKEVIGDYNSMKSIRNESEIYSSDVNIQVPAKDAKIYLIN